jgi:hypothetical protein
VAFGDNVRRRRREDVFARIIAALRFRVAKVVREPSVTELEFISLTVNHGQFSEKLRRLGLFAAAEEIQKNAFHVGLRWMELAQEHLDDAAASLLLGEKDPRFQGHTTLPIMRPKRCVI